MGKEAWDVAALEVIKEDLVNAYYWLDPSLLWNLLCTVFEDNLCFFHETVEDWRMAVLSEWRISIGF